MILERDEKPRVLILAPSQPELTVLLPYLEVEGRMESYPFVLLTGSLFGVDVALARTGIGPLLAARAMEIALSRLEAREVLLYGFCGGLDETLAAGELVAAEDVVLDKAPTSPSRAGEKGRESKAGVEVKEGAEGEGEKERSSEVLLARAEETGLLAGRARALTVGEVAAGPREKRALGRRSGASMVEMEGHPVLAASRRARLPALMVRTVLDAVDEELPDSAGVIDEAGEIRKLSLAARLLRHPGELLLYGRLGRNAVACHKRLRTFLEAYLSRSRRGS